LIARRFYSCSLLLLVCNAVALAAGQSLEEIRALRLRGELPQALALADYYYRAEMDGRIFEHAFGHAEAAIQAFSQLEDRHGQADAVHRLGLIHLQRRELLTAGLLFEESLLLDRLAGERAFFRGEYERHMGFVISLQGNNESALPYFERSLQFRMEAGAIDASMFAAITLASALIELGRAEEARPHIEYAQHLAKKMDSKVGLARTASLREQPTTSL
jgi:tetratricopeptide (TPR) repeat protein